MAQAHTNGYARTLWLCQATVVVVGLGLGMIFLAFGSPLLSIYNTNPDVIHYGLIRMAIICPTYFLCGMMDTTVGQLRGVGYSILPIDRCLLRGLACCACVDLYILRGRSDLEYPVYFLSISWGATFLIHLLCYAIADRKLAKKFAVAS